MLYRTPRAKAEVIFDSNRTLKLHVSQGILNGPRSSLRIDALNMTLLTVSLMVSTIKLTHTSQSNQ